MKLRDFRFYKKEYGNKVRWWINISPWVFPERLLIMYPSAEKWLEKIGNGSDEILISVGTNAFSGSETLHRTEYTNLFLGAYYTAKSYKQKPTNYRMLLCIVTVYVFGRYPKYILQGSPYATLIYAIA